LSIVIRMNIYLVEILGKNTLNRFTVTQLNDAYSKLSGDKCTIKTRKFVYRETIRLLRKDVLKRSGGRYSRSTIYEKTDLFHNIKFIDKQPQEMISQRVTGSKVINHDDMVLDSELDNTLQQYKVDMMSAIGESEEYLRLLRAFPEIKNILSHNYELAKNNSSKLLGKIKAISATLSIRDRH
jgi:hypothetical protein